MDTLAIRNKIVTYACETWYTNKRLAILERNVLRNIFGLVYAMELKIFETTV